MITTRRAQRWDKYVWEATALYSDTYFEAMDISVFYIVNTAVCLMKIGDFFLKQLDIYNVYRINIFMFVYNSPISNEEL
ncbi:MAG: hypothetical protein V4714_01925 [Bacteroidota bacterium]